MPHSKKLRKNWHQFEPEVGELVRAFGYQAQTTQPSHDYGVDVMASHSKRTVIIQCKLYSKGSIGVEAILKLIGSQHLFKAEDAVCITTSHYTKKAKEIASKQKVHLVDLPMLLLLCRKHNLTVPSVTVLKSADGEINLISKPILSIGRAEDNDIVLNDLTVSKHHAQINRKGMCLIVTDCGSTNGTYVNGKNIISPSFLNYDDELRLGNQIFHIRLHLHQPA